MLALTFSYRKSATFVTSRNTNIDCILTEFLILLTLFNSLKVVLINMVATLTMPAKLATLGLLKIKVYWIQGYDVIISAYDAIKKFYHMSQVII